MNFTVEQLEEIEQLAGLNYSILQISMYFAINIDDLYVEFQNPDSLFRFHHDRGQLLAQAEIDKANLESAKKGNITAMTRYDKKVKEAKILAAKERIFGRS